MKYTTRDSDPNRRITMKKFVTKAFVVLRCVTLHTHYVMNFQVCRDSVQWILKLEWNMLSQEELLVAFASPNKEFP